MVFFVTFKKDPNFFPLLWSLERHPPSNADHIFQNKGKCQSDDSTLNPFACMCLVVSFVRFSTTFKVSINAAKLKCNITHLRVNASAWKFVFHNHNDDSEHAYHQSIIAYSLSFLKKSFPSTEPVTDVWFMFSGRTSLKTDLIYNCVEFNT